MTVYLVRHQDGSIKLFSTLEYAEHYYLEHQEECTPPTEQEVLSPGRLFHQYVLYYKFDSNGDFYLTNLEYEIVTRPAKKFKNNGAKAQVLLTYPVSIPKVDAQYKAMITGAKYCERSKH